MRVKRGVIERTILDEEQNNGSTHAHIHRYSLLPPPPPVPLFSMCAAPCESRSLIEVLFSLSLCVCMEG